MIRVRFPFQSNLPKKGFRSFCTGVHPDLWKERLIQKEIQRINKKRDEKAKAMYLQPPDLSKLDPVRNKLVCPVCSKPNALIVKGKQTLKHCLISYSMQLMWISDGALWCWDSTRKCVFEHYIWSKRCRSNFLIIFLKISGPPKCTPRRSNFNFWR